MSESIPSQPSTDSGLPPAAKPEAVGRRAWGPFFFERLVEKSDTCTVWWGQHRDSGRMVTVCIPRKPAPEPWRQKQYLDAVQEIKKLNHPHIAKIFTFGIHEHWPYLAADSEQGKPLPMVLGEGDVWDPVDATRWVIELLEGLSFAHQSSVATAGLEYGNCLVDERGHFSLLAWPFVAAIGASEAQTHQADSAHLIRAAAQMDVQRAGVILHRLLVGKNAMEGRSVAEVIGRSSEDQPLRLPILPHLQLPPALRSVVNRSTSGKASQKFLSARTFVAALRGWLESAGAGGDGPVATLIQRISQFGLLPAKRQSLSVIQRVVSIENLRNDELAQVILHDMALSMELLNQSNHAQTLAGYAHNGPILTVRRAIAMLGTDGLRAAAAPMKPLPESASKDRKNSLKRCMQRTHLTGLWAQALRPPEIDGEVVFIASILHHLGDLLLCTHFAEEFVQIENLTLECLQSQLSVSPAGVQRCRQQSTLSVLGISANDLGIALIRHWGWGDGVLKMMQPLSDDTVLRVPVDDMEWLRLIVGAAVGFRRAMALKGRAQSVALDALVTRFGKVLDFGHTDLSRLSEKVSTALQKGCFVDELEDEASELKVRPHELSHAFSDLQTDLGELESRQERDDN